MSIVELYGKYVLTVEREAQICFPRDNFLVTSQEVQFIVCAKGLLTVWYGLLDTSEIKWKAQEYKLSPLF